MRSAVNLTLGDDVRYAGLNLDTTVGGELRLATEPNRSANATGTLRLAGTYDAYGQRLELERGQLLFSGPMDDPGLDVRAVRKLETTPDVNRHRDRSRRRAHGHVEGAAHAHRRDPGHERGRRLSYLAVRPARERQRCRHGHEETSALQTAALSLGLQQALPVVQRIGNSLGLDELTVQSTTTDAGELMAGNIPEPEGLHPLQLRLVQPHRRLAAALQDQRPLEHRDALRRPEIDGPAVHHREELVLACYSIVPVRYARRVRSGSFSIA